MKKQKNFKWYFERIIALIELTIICLGFIFITWAILSFLIIML